MKVYRLEFLQPDGRWTGPYCAEYMTPRAFELRKRMNKTHDTQRPWPNEAIFAANPGKDRYVCASSSMKELVRWFGGYLVHFIHEGGHVAVYEVPEGAIAQIDSQQIVYQQRQAVCLSRKGQPVALHLVVRKIFSA